MIKKTTLILTAIVTGMFLTSCGGKKDEAKKGEENTEAATEEKTEAPEAADFTSEAGKFTIKFKATPTEQTQDVPTEIGNVTMYMFMHEESVTKAYMVAYCDYPSELIKLSDPVTLLQGSKGGVVGKFQATITDEKVGKFQGYDCIDFTAGGPQYNTAYKLVLADNRLYQVGILQDGSAVTPEDIASFIGSFKINSEAAAEAK